MADVIIDGAAVTCREELHRVFAKALDFPEWYGGNLDALYDLLGGVNMPASITIVHSGMMSDEFSGYMERVLRVILRAAEQNPNIKLYLG